MLVHDDLVHKKKQVALLIIYIPFYYLVMFVMTFVRRCCILVACVGKYFSFVHRREVNWVGIVFTCSGWI